MNTNYSNNFYLSLLQEQLFNSIEAPFPRLTPRQLHSRLTFPGKATVIIGMRRSGKTYFLHQIRQEKHKQEKIPRERLPYINLEDERLAGMGVTHLSALVESYYRRFPEFRNQHTVTWCFDEIQNLSGWERFIRRLLDTEKVEIFLTGSSATLLSREIATAMRGRAWEVPILPFSFREFLAHRGVSFPENLQMITTAKRSQFEALLLDYLKTGGFPEVQGMDNATRFRLLSDYVDVVILRDIVERHQVRNVTSLRWLVRHVLGNPGSLFSVEKFYRSLRSQGLSVSKDTLHELLKYLEDSFLVRISWMESTSERQRMVNPRKIYPIDPGFIPIFDRSGKSNLGHALETVVRVELERRGYSVTYVRIGNGYEVDFLARSPSGEQTLIQVCADLTDEETRSREVRALEQAVAKFSRAQPVLLTLTPEAAKGISGTIAVYSAAMWLLKTGGQD